MNVEQIMTSGVACCGRDSTLAECAQLMLKNDCGCIPVTENTDGSGRVIGLITDRDITCRAVANGMDPNTTTVGECMSPGVMSVRPGMSVKEAERIMQDMQVRRVPVVGEDGSCIGMISQADIALATSNDELANVVKNVSKPYMA
jgi:CBS domain-containing protein